MDTEQDQKPAIVTPVDPKAAFQVAAGPTCTEFDPDALLAAAPPGGKPVTDAEWNAVQQKACAQPQTPSSAMGR